MSLSGTWKWNGETGETTASEEVFQVFGLPPRSSPVPADLFLSRIVPEDRPLVEAALQAALSERKPYQIEYRLNLPDGSQRLVLASGEWYDGSEQGVARIVIGVVQDITLRRHAEQSLKESEQRFRQLFDNAVDGVFIGDLEGRYTDVNLSACRMLGYSRGELVGKYITDLVPEAERERFARTREYFLQNNEHVDIAEWVLIHKNGAYVPVEVSSRILPDGRWMAIVRDIGERKRTQKELEAYAAEVQDLYDNAPCGYHSLDKNGVLVRINKTELGWLGYTSEELLGKKKFFELLTESSRQTFHDYFPRFLATGRIRDIELEIVCKDGRILPVLISGSAIYDEQGNFLRSRTTLFDMTEMAAAQKELRRAAAVFSHTNDAIIITNADGTIVAVNEAFSAITGYSPDEVIGKNPRLLKSERQDDAFYRGLWSALEKTGSWKGEIWDRRKSGEVFPVWETITAVKDDSGRITDYISIFSDITTIKETEERLLKLAYHDVLTGLPNRLLFNDRITQALAHAKRHQLRIALLLLDLDRFKLINDTLGHSAGDQLLQIIGERLKRLVRDEDTVARLGGDEFAIVINQLDDTGDAALLARKVGEVVSRPARIAGQMLTVSTSIGIGIYPDDAEDHETLSKCADVAMYDAKERGKNTYAFYTREMTRAATDLLAIDHGLRAALGKDEFVLFYQPQIDLASRAIVGVEALIRWNHPKHGLLTPDAFIDVAEETGLIDAIGDWVFDAACAQIQAWKRAGLPPLRIAINLSARQIRKKRFMEDMRDKLLACQPFEGFGIDLEITETALQTDADTVHALRGLKSFGLKVVIDDFGTGYSCLNSLKQLPVDVLKIDRSFIHGIPADGDDRAIATAIIGMAHSLEMSVIAEGVETREQLQFVMDQRCDEVQGFLFFQPLSAPACEQVLRSGWLEGVSSRMVGPAGIGA